MQRPISEYQAMSPAQILDDPDAPETLKIRARNQLSQQQEQLSAAALKEKEFMEGLSRYAYERAAQANYELSEAERIERMAYERAAQEGTEADMQRTGW